MIFKLKLRNNVTFTLMQMFYPYQLVRWKADISSVSNDIKCIIKIHHSCYLSNPVGFPWRSCAHISRSLLGDLRQEYAGPKVILNKPSIVCYISITIQMSSRLVWGTPRGGIWCPSIINAMESMYSRRKFPQTSKNKKASLCGSLVTALSDINPQFYSVQG